MQEAPQDARAKGIQSLDGSGQRGGKVDAQRDSPGARCHTQRSLALPKELRPPVTNCLVRDQCKPSHLHQFGALLE
eukprot:7384053-Prymnesium_polylepis.2